MTDSKHGTHKSAAQVPPLAMPVGRRSCRKEGGEWTSCHAHDEAGELQAVKMLTRSPQDFALLKREMRRKVELAAEGRLTYGKKADVYACTTAPSVLELRFDSRVQYPNGKRAVRLYFSEPAVLPGVLLALLYAAKPATAGGLDLQDEHMAHAQLRIEGHPGL